MPKKKSRRKNSKKGKSPTSSPAPAEGKVTSTLPARNPGCIHVDQVSNDIIDETQLFSQETTDHYHGECPICLLPYSPDIDQFTTQYKTCCSTFICYGCVVAAGVDKVNAPCPFCRTPITSSKAELLSRVRKRSNAGDAAATHFLVANSFALLSLFEIPTAPRGKLPS